MAIEDAEIATLVEALITTNREVRKVLKKSEENLQRALDRMEVGDEPLAILRSMLSSGMAGSGTTH
jgi:hypothetical protein